MKTFDSRAIELTIRLGTGTFGEGLGDTVTLSGLRMFVDVAAPCGESMGAIQMRVFGLQQSMMNQLTTIGVFGQVAGSSQILVSAGNEGEALTEIFKGSIWQAWADYNNAPEVAFNIIGYVGMNIALKPVKPTPYPESVDVATAMQTFATQAGYAFHNSGVNKTLPASYWDRDLLTQIKSCARDADIYYKIENGTLTIWPKDGYVEGGKPLISPETGMVGYPSISSQGMMIKTLFIPGIVMGGLIEVKSSIKMASGTFRVLNYTHSLSAVAVGGPWFTEILCFPLLK